MARVTRSSVRGDAPRRKDSASPYFEPPIERGKQKRAPLLRRASSGVSKNKFPPISAPVFGLFQEKLWREPFWLLIAVTFLNKTSGRASAPVFWQLKERYPTPQDLAAADEAGLIESIRHLGLQTQRARRLIKMAAAWSERQPQKGQQFRTLNYPIKGEGKGLPPAVEADPAVCSGMLEIGYMPGCGPYAWDSWRIFCRDHLRGVADDYDGLNAADLEPEWKRVLPLDKELRAYLRWMWLREGSVWNCDTGKRRPVNEQERARSIKGELEPEDEEEAQATVQVNEQVYEEPPRKRKRAKR